MSCLSNLFDNIIWGINIEVLGPYFSNHYKAFKANKYFFSLAKIILKMLGSYFDILGSNFEHHHRIKNMK